MSKNQGGYEVPPHIAPALRDLVYLRVVPNVNPLLTKVKMISRKQP